MSDKKTHWPFGGFFLKLSDEKNGTHEYENYLKECEEEKQLPEEELEFHCSKDPKKMTMQESLEEVDRFLCWNKMTPEERRAELEAQKAATRATEQAAGDMPCAMEPESAPDTPQGAVLDEAVDAPPDVDSVPGDVSGDAPESAADTVSDNVPDATEGYVPDAAEGDVPERAGDTAPDSVQDDDLDTIRETAPDAAKGNAPDAIGALTAQEKEVVDATAQGVIAPEATAAENAYATRGRAHQTGSRAGSRGRGNIQSTDAKACRAAGRVLYRTGGRESARGGSGACRSNRDIGTDRRGRPGGEGAVGVCLGIDR